MHSPRVAMTLACLAGITGASHAQAAPTLGADFDLGTATKPLPMTLGPPDPVPAPRSTLYAIGFGLRAGWRFDVLPFLWIVPEIGAQHTILRTYTFSYAFEPESHVSRVFGGGRAGWSLPVAPELRLELAVYGHGGLGWYHLDENGPAADIGGALDVRFGTHFSVGAQGGYNVVTVLHPLGPTIMTVTGTYHTGGAADANPWVSYGLHGAVTF